MTYMAFSAYFHYGPLGLADRPILKPKTLYLERGMSGCGFREWAQSSSEEAATGQCERRHFRVRPIKPGAVQTSSWVSEADAGSFIKLEPLVERGPQGPLLESQD